MKITKPLYFQKTTISIFILFLFITSKAESSNCNYTWIQQNSGTTSLLFSVEAVNELICWTCGASGTVRKTTDGGITWQNANPNMGITTGNIYNIEAIDGNNAWVTTFQGVMTYIYKTSNGGVNWLQVLSQNGGYINGIHMTSTTHGFAFGDPIANVWQILVTTNGGSNWTHFATSPASQPAEQGFRNCFQVSLPYIWFGSYPGRIFRSKNNGVNWSVHSTPGIASVLSIHFNSSDMGFASSINMVKSVDTGSTYQQLFTEGLGNINGIEGKGNDVWYVRGNYIYFSSNAGSNWIQVYNASITQQDIDFPDSTGSCLMGWAVGYGGTIAKLTVNPVGVNANNSNIPKDFILEQNYPNPFNPVTTINFSIPKANYVTLTIFNAEGKMISKVVDGYKQAGIYNIELNTSNLASGMYFYKLETGNFTATKKMVLLK
jgi:photosystem II stability/assembly factor-like uncharacterized protein